MIRCSCGNQLAYETDICEVCLPNGIGPLARRPNVQKQDLEHLARAMKKLLPTALLNEVLGYLDPLRTFEAVLKGEEESSFESVQLRLIRSWERSAADHDKRADAANDSNDSLNFNRQEAFAYAARLHADQLRALLRVKE